MQKNSFYPLMPVVFLLVCVGCSGGNRPKDLPRLFPVTLTITMDDQPLADATVMLYAENTADAKWTIGGQTDATGNVTIVSHGQFHGAPAGKFKVCVTKSEMKESAPERVLASAPTENTTMGFQRPTHLVDPLFADSKSTPLEIEVSPKGTTNLTLSVHKPR